jgi:hypothetical protein
MIVLSWITKSVNESQKYRLVSSLDDSGNFGTVIHTIYMSCTENKDVPAVASNYGIAKCNSNKQCASVIDGESINVALCNLRLSPDCGRQLFKAFDTYQNIPNRFLKLPCPSLLGRSLIGDKSLALIDRIPAFSMEGSAADSYLMIPRSEASMKRTSISTSSPRSGSAFNFSSACDVFSFDASKVLYAW